MRKVPPRTKTKTKTKKWLPLLKTNRFIHSMLGDLLLTRQTIKISSSTSFYLCPAKKKWDALFRGMETFRMEIMKNEQVTKQ